MSRDTAAKSRYKLPRNVFKLYKSAEAHTKHKHALPMAAKVLMLAVPLLAFLLFKSYDMIHAKFNPQEQARSDKRPAAQSQNVSSVLDPSKLQPASLPLALPPGFEVYTPGQEKRIDKHHPFEGMQFSITGYLHNASLNDVYHFNVIRPDQSSFSLTSLQLQKSGYSIIPVSDCVAKITYPGFEFFATCGSASVVPPPAFGQARF